MKKKTSTIFASGLAAVCALSCVACGTTETQPITGTFVLDSATMDGVDCTDDFQTYTATFSEDGNLRVVIGYLGSIETRNSTYTFDGTTVTETYREDTFTYTKEGEGFRTQYDGISVLLGREEEETGPQPVDFEDVLFGPDVSDSKIFNYCPAILKETVDGEEWMHVWYCTNKDDGVIMDHIGYRKGVKQDDGKWLFSEQQIVLAPTPGTWDSRHTCDPAVIRGEFRYEGNDYTYLMAYLGCTTEDYQKNETGIAVANAPEGPWVKVASLNPIVPWYDNGVEAEEQEKYEDMQGTSRIYWGTGMPALISLDGQGDVLMFYQSTLQGTGIQRWNFSDLDNPTCQFTTRITHNGIVNSAGQRCNIGIPDFAYDPVAKRFYVCGVTNEKNPADVTTTRVNSHSMVAYLEDVQSTEQLCTLLQSGSYVWKMAGFVGPSDTGWERNHNPGIVRDERGFLPESDGISVIVSTGHNSWDNENIFTYRLHGATISLEDFLT